MAVGLDIFKPAFRVAFDCGRQLVGANAQPAMSPRSCADIITVAPVHEVVAALGARPGMVGNLVSRKSVCFRYRLGKLIELRPQLGVGYLQLARVVEREERRAFLDGQLIQGEMVGSERDRPLQLGLPSVHGLIRTRVDEIERQSRKRLARHVDCLERGIDIMQPSQQLQIPVMQGLDPQ